MRESGATPATIGVIEGKVRIGLTREEIEKLAKGGAAKVAARDVPYAVAAKLDGGTTVSATARIALGCGDRRDGDGRDWRSSSGQRLDARCFR